MNSNYDVFSMQLMKNDIDDYMSIFNYLNGKNHAYIFSLSTMPYISLCAFESYKYIKEREIINGDSVFDIKTVSKVRNKVKIFENKQYRKIKKVVDDIDYIQHLDFSSRLRFKFFKRFNWYYSLGIYYFNKNISFNTQLAYHYTFPIAFSDKSRKDIESDYMNGEIVKYPDMGNTVREYAYQTSSFLSSLSKELEFLSNHYSECKFNNFSDTLLDRDFNTNRYKKIGMQKELSKSDNLILLYILCVANSLVYYYSKIVSKDNGFGIRIKYTAYEYILNITNVLLKKWSDTSNTTTTAYITLKRINNNCNKTIINQQFGNVMRHYRINENEISKELILNKKLCGLVENYFEDMDADKYEFELDTNLKYISQELSSLYDDLKRPESYKG